MSPIFALLVAAVLGCGAAAPAAAAVPAAAPAESNDETAVRGAIETYHRGFQENHPGGIRKALGDSFVMFNGNHSDDPTRWQAHLYLQGEELDGWPSWMIAEAGPFVNRFTFERTHVRDDAALAVTVETGRNRFRSWNGQRVTWLLGRHAGRWGIVGMFVRDERNPGSTE